MAGMMEWGDQPNVCRSVAGVIPLSTMSVVAVRLRLWDEPPGPPNLVYRSRKRRVHSL